MRVDITITFGDCSEADARSRLQDLLEYLGKSNATLITLAADEVPFDTAAVVQAGFALGKAQAAAKSKKS